MKELSSKRAVCAMPIAGSYRSIDFALSNMTNSHIQKVAVFTQYNAGSLNEHLISSKWWNFGRKQGGLFTFTPSVTAENNFWYRGTADAMAQNLSFLKNSHEPYVVIASGDCVYKMDYNKVLEYHVAKKADITVVCKDMPAGVNVDRFGTVKMNEESRIEEFEEKPVVAKSNTISCGIYVVRRRQLIEMIEKCAEEDRYDFVKDILIGLFTSNPETIKIGMMALHIISLGFIVSAVSVTCSGTLEGLGMGMASLMISLSRYVVVIIPTAFLLSRVWGADGVFYAFPVTELATAVFAFVIYRKSYKV